MLKFSPLGLSYWSHTFSTASSDRHDLVIKSFEEFENIFKNPEPIKDKAMQKIMTRQWQESRKAGNEVVKGGFFISLDYDKSEETAVSVHEKLKQLKLCHILFTTYGNKTHLNGNKGLPRFKVFLPFKAANQKELDSLTSALGYILNKRDMTRNDDFSNNIYFGGVYPDNIDDFEFYSYQEGMQNKEARNYLSSIDIPNSFLNAKTTEPNEMDEFERYTRSEGQEYSIERVKKALDRITGEPVGDLSSYEIWLKTVQSCASTGDEEVKELVLDWAHKTFANNGDYEFNRYEKENLNLWDNYKQRYDGSMTLGTLFYISSLYNNNEQQEPTHFKDSSWQDYVSMLEQPNKEIPFLVNELIVENTVGVLAGMGGVGKSTVSFELAAAISSGSTFLGKDEFTTKKGTVVILNKEDSEQKVRRQVHLDFSRQQLSFVKHKQQFLTDEDFNDNLNVSDAEKTSIKKRYENIIRPSWVETATATLTNENGADDKKVNDLIDSFKQLQRGLEENGRPPIKLVIFDPLNLWHGGDQNLQKDMSAVFSVFQKIQKELETTVLLIHHMNKSSGFSGSHVIRDFSRFMFYFRPAKIHPSIDSEKYLEFYVDKHNDARAGYKAFYVKRLDGGLFQFVGVDEIQREIDELVEQKIIKDAEMAARKAEALKEAKARLSGE